MNTSSKQTQRVNVRVLTLNLHKGFNAFNRKFVLPELKTAIHQVGADIVFLQEVVGAHAVHASRLSHWPSVSQYEYLADSVWGGFAYGRNAIYPAGHHGNALLSKFPIVEHRNIDVTYGITEQRGILYCRLDIPGTDVHLHAICIHLGLREKHRQHQIDLLLQLINGLPAQEPIIIAGDFNDWRLFSNARLINAGQLIEVFTNAYGYPAQTFPARYPLLRLDRIYSRNLSLNRPLLLPQRPWTHLSDHAPLAAEFELSVELSIEVSDEMAP